jgi:integrase
MAKVYRTMHGYGIDYRFPPTRQGKRIREFIGPNKEEAKAVLAEREKAIRLGKNPVLQRIQPKRFDETVTEFLEKHVKLRGLHERTFKKNSDRLLLHFKGRCLQEIGPPQIEDYLVARQNEGISQATANRERSLLSAIFKFAIRRGYFAEENPCKRVQAYRESPGRLRYLTGDEATALICKAAKHLKPILLCGLHTGGRHSELLSLTWADVDLAQGTIYFDRDKTKSGKQREIPITPALDRVLREQHRKRLTGGDARDYVFTWGRKRIASIRTAFNKARKDAGLGADVTPHTLRHTFASWYMMNGGDIFRLKKYLGHSDIHLTERYSHLSPNYMKAGAAFIGAPPESGGRAVDDLVKSPLPTGSTNA